MMIIGELCNFGAYAFVAAIIVVRAKSQAYSSSSPEPTFYLLALRLLWALSLSSYALFSPRYFSKKSSLSLDGSDALNALLGASS